MKSVSINISESELLDALRESMPGPVERPPGVMTAREIAEQLGVSPRVAQERTRGLVKAGRAEMLKVRVVDASGRNAYVSAYRMVPTPKKKAKR